MEDKSTALQNVIDSQDKVLLNMESVEACKCSSQNDATDSSSKQARNNTTCTYLNLSVTLTVLVTLTYIIYVTVWTASFSYEVHEANPSSALIGHYVAITFVLLTIGTFLVTLRDHLVNYNFQSHLRKYFIKIAFLMPLYGTINLACLWAPEGYVYLNILLKLYVAYCVYDLFHYWLKYLSINYNNDKVVNAEQFNQTDLQYNSHIPKRYTNTFVKFCVYQMFAVRLLFFCIGITTQALGVYRTSHLVMNGFFVYDTSIGFVSELICAYGLFVMYKSNGDALSPLRPGLALIFINLMNILPAFPAVIVGGLVQFKFLSDKGQYVQEYGLGEQLSIGLPCIIITFLMFVLSVCLMFSYKKRSTKSGIDTTMITMSTAV